MALEERVELDVEEALRGIDSIETALTSAAGSFKVALADALDLLQTVAVEEVDASAVTSGIDSAVAAADTTTTVEADASNVTEGIDQAVGAADNTVTIDAITDQVTDEIEQAVAAADTTVDIEANSSGLDQVQNQADSAGGSLTDLAGKAALVNDALKGAAGEGGAAASAVGKLGPEGAAAAASLAVLTGVVGKFFNEALQAQTATDRFRDIFGGFSAEVEHVDLLGLNTSLKDLTNNLGADDDAVRQSLANFGQLGLAAGRSQQAVAGSAEQLLVLASAVAAANPALGTTEDVLNRLPQALARGGRFAAQYGLDLDRAAIAARAVANAHGDAAAATDQFALREAGLQLALEQIPDAADRIDKGFDKPIIKLRAFQQAQKEAQESAGGNFLAPLQAAFTALEPILTSITRLLGAGLGLALRLVLANLAPLFPLLQVTARAAGLLASAIEFINRQLDRLGGFVIEQVKSKLKALIDLYNRIPVLPNIDTSFLDAGNAAGAAVAPTEAYAGAITDVGGAASFAATQLANAFDAHVGLVDAQQSLASAQRNVRNAQEGITEAVTKGGGATKSAAERSLELRQAQLGVVSAQSGLQDSTDALAEAQQKLADIFVVTEEETKRIEAAQRSLEQAQRGYKDATDRVSEAQQHLADVTRAATAAEADKARRDVRRAELGQADAEDRLQAAQLAADSARLALQRSQGRSLTTQARAAEAADDANRALEQAQLDVADAADRTGEAQAAAADKLDGTIGTAKDATDAQSALQDALQAQSDAAVAVRDAQVELQTAQEATTVSSKELSDAQREVEKAQLAHEQAALAVDQAEQNLTTTMNGSAGAAGGASTSVHALRDAQEALRDAQLALLGPMTDVLDKQNLLADGSLTAKEHAENQIIAYRNLAATLAPGSELRNFLTQTADQLQTDFDRTYNTVIDADTNPARQSINELLDDLSRILPGIPGGQNLAQARLKPQGAMAGVNDFSGGFLTVGERGPETLFIAPSQSATVVPNNQRGAFAAAMSQRPINVQIFEVAGDPRATAFAVGARLGEDSQR